MVRIT
jgi:hypothetical protein